MATLRAKGNGQLVYNADEFRWGGTYYRRITDPVAPHNVYSDAKSLRIMATKVGATNTPLDEPLKAVWRFRTDAPLAERPSGGIIRVDYPLNKIEYRYDRATNTYLRGVSGAKKQIDPADGQAGRAKERRGHDGLVRAAQRRLQQASPRGPERRQRQGLDRHERPDDRGDLEEVRPWRDRRGSTTRTASRSR